MLKKLQDEGNFTKLMVMQEELKSYPFGDVWEEYCNRVGVDAGMAWFEKVCDYEKKTVLPRFFKTGKGEYGEGDKFIGVTVPNVRKVAKQYIDTPLSAVEALLESEWHECRLCALLILVQRYKLGKDAERGRQKR